MASHSKALRRLSHKPAGPEHHTAFNEQASAEKNDRGACLLYAANLENLLDMVFDAALEINDDNREQIYGESGLLGSFSRKISMAFVLRIIGIVTFDNLTLIRHIRNTFAHAKIPIDF
jgi:hypothetical protein